MNGDRCDTPARRAEGAGVGIAVALVGAVFLYAALKVPARGEVVGPGFVPTTTAAFILMGGLWLALSPLTTRRAGPGAGEPHKFFWVVLPAAGLALAYLWLWPALGWLLATLVIVPVFFAVFGARGWRELVLAPLVLVGVLWAIFFWGLNLYNMPGWLIERIVPA